MQRAHLRAICMKLTMAPHMMLQWSLTVYIEKVA